MMSITAVIDEALDACKALDPDVKVRVSNRVIIDWIREHHPEINIHDTEMANNHWMKLIRDRRKERTPENEQHHSSQICFDFGLSEMQLDSEISIPRNALDPIYGGCYWKEADDATLEEISLHIDLLNAQSQAILGKAKNWRSVFRAAAKYAGGDLQKTLGQLRILARAAKDSSGAA
jgi:hypothetical protein